MQTITDRLHGQGKELIAGVATLHGGNYRLPNINDGFGGIVVLTPTPYHFRELTIDQKRLQSKLLANHRHFFELAVALTNGQPTEVKHKLLGHQETVRAVIEADSVSYPTSDDAVEGVRDAVTKTLDEILNLFDPTDSGVLLLPDTNALVASPVFQKWVFEDFPRFDILLVPTVLSELDAHCHHHRNEGVRSKAKRVVRQVKEYRRRGSLSDGVYIVKGRTRLFSTAVEPRVSDTLPWLDPAMMDDRILASFVEAVRTHPRSTVVLVTGDINLQNKADFARFPVVEPPNGDD